MERRFLKAILFLVCVLTPFGRCQEGVRDDSHVENVVHKAVADEFSSEILTNRTRAYLSCASGEMVVKINFSEPFRGITYVDYDKTSPCKFYGDGRKYYELRIPLKGCGTKQEAPRVFINNIIVRFHRSLELEEDEIKTIICRYPPPLAPPPTNVIAPIIEPPPILPATKHPKLSEVELLLIICALLFLTLLLLGIGIAYYCLKKRNIKVVKKKKGISSAPASEITKISGSTMGTPSMFDAIRIPRASTSGSEAALLTPVSAQRSETIPSDYPSESPSSASDAEEVVEQRHVLVSAVPVQKQYDNVGFAGEPYPVDAEKAESLSSVQIATVYKPSIPRAKAKPYPMDQEREESISSLQQAQMILKPASAKQLQLQAITESEDQLDAETVEKSYVAVSRVAAAPPTAYKVEPPVYTKVRKKEEPRPPSLYGSIPDNDDWSHSEVEFAADMKPLIRKPKRTTQMVTDYLVTKQDDTYLREDVTKRRQDTLRSLALPSEAPDTSVSEITAIPETALAPRKPKITVKNIDEVFVTTEHETIATEHVVKTTKDTTEQLVKSPTTPPSWDVTIRHYSLEDDGPSGPGSPPRSPSGQPPYTDRRTWEEDTKELTRTTATTTADHRLRTSFEHEPRPPVTPTPPQWDVLNRVISPPPVEGVQDLTPDVKTKWRTLVTVDDVFRTLVHEATTTEEFVRISHDFRYEAMFERRVWDVIIRVLTHPDYLHPPIQAEFPPEVRPPRYRKNQEQRRKSSLPHVLAGAGIPADLRSLPESHRSNSIGDFDMRSMTEIDVDFSRLERESISSDDTVRTGLSITDRATSEFLEDIPSVEGRASIDGYLPVVERMTAAPPVGVDTDDARSDATFDVPSGRFGPGGAQGASRTFVERSSRQYIEDLPGSQSRITSDHMRMQTSRVVRTGGLERAPSMDGREEIKSITEQDIYDWLR
ncbi:uncharacterized protein LOC144116121 [Amblyomma americanum]